MSLDKPRANSVDFDLIRKNANEQSVNLAEIASSYEGLSSEQVASMKAAAVIAHESEEETVLGSSGIGRFGADGSVIFPEFATGVHYLGA